jgi:hypothetical protein
MLLPSKKAVQSPIAPQMTGGGGIPLGFKNGNAHRALFR